MAAPTYTTDLADWIPDATTTAWGELTGAIAGGAPDEADTESALQGTNTVSQATNTVNVFSMCRILGASADLTGLVAFVWHGHGVATALETYALDGLGVVFATDLGNWESFTVAGSDTAPFPYGKWINSAVDPTFATNDRSNGTPPAVTAIYGIGSIGELTAAVAKGQPHVCDMIRTGRGEARFAGGETSNYATFAGFATQNDTTTNRWGLMQSTSGGYQWKGLMVLGFGALVDFRDSNVNIFIQDSRKVLSTFNKIEVRNASSNIEWTNISILSLGTLSRGDWECIDDATVLKTGCTFTDMGTFIYKSNSDVISSSYNRCDLVTTGGGLFSKVLFDDSIGSASVITAALSSLDKCVFNSDGSNHAVELTGFGGGSMTWDNTETGYVAGVSGTNVASSSTGNETIYLNFSSAATFTINVAAGASVPSIRKAAGMTGNVNIVAGAVTLQLTVQNTAGTKIQNARALVTAGTGGPFPGDVTVTITTVTTTASVAHTAHGLANGDKVLITGAVENELNGIQTISNVSTNAYDYTITSIGSAPGTGTIKSSFVIISGLTDVDGLISDTRTYSTNQLLGADSKVRKSSGSPNYKTGAVVGTVSSTTGLSATIILLDDE
jgi:hypothetical protein